MHGTEIEIRVPVVAAKDVIWRSCLEPIFKSWTQQETDNR